MTLSAIEKYAIRMNNWREIGKNTGQHGDASVMKLALPVFGIKGLHSICVGWFEGTYMAIVYNPNKVVSGELELTQINTESWAKVGGADKVSEVAMSVPLHLDRLMVRGIWYYSLYPYKKKAPPESLVIPYFAMKGLIDYDGPDLDDQKYLDTLAMIAGCMSKDTNLFLKDSVIEAAKEAMIKRMTWQSAYLQLCNAAGIMPNTNFAQGILSIPF